MFAYFHSIFNNIFGHIQTIVAFLLPAPKDKFNYSKLKTKDNDFIQIAENINQAKTNKKIIILIHGFEGTTKSKYILRANSYFSKFNYDIISWNQRGQSKEDNLKAYTYHAGKTIDLELVIDHILQKNQYKQIYIIGFSLGANLALKYIGDKENSLNKSIKKVVSISNPFNLKDASFHLLKKSNFIYNHKFNKSIKKKIIKKNKTYPNIYPLSLLNKIKSVVDYDQLITAPLNNYKDNIEYWKENSSIKSLNKIRVNTLIIYSKNDPLLPKSALINKTTNKFISFKITNTGGHVGFIKLFNKNFLWITINNYLTDSKNN